MPRYEYICETSVCEAVQEISRPVADRHLPVKCENCGGSMVLAPSLSSFTLAGGGWTPRGNTPAPPRTPRRRGGYDMTGDRDL